ncbi:MAG: hypothetical protein CH6_4041 [Candidatus Kapaibacterium sp.]|nr:MAG: hypothetical protein CH6_4041 [Candidatus Kapabacteria bacterium]
MIYFISDVHLGYYTGKKNNEIEHVLLSFLDIISTNCQVLVIVGDLFDFWFDYKTVIPKHFFRTVAKLDDLKRMGKEIIYLMGNHDFGHFQFFKKELGIEVIENDISIEFFGKKFYISHGDGKIKNDLGYLILKQILRNKISRYFFRFIHPDLGIFVAKNSSRKSRKYTHNRSKKNFDSLFDFAKQKIDQGYDFVIMGHTHKPEIRSYKGGFYINLGDWLSKPMVGIFDGFEIKLVPVEEIINYKIKE